VIIGDILPCATHLVTANMGSREVSANVRMSEDYSQELPDGRLFLDLLPVPIITISLNIARKTNYFGQGR
jgi:hypothetical protein